MEDTRGGHEESKEHAWARFTDSFCSRKEEKEGLDASVESVISSRKRSRRWIRFEKTRSIEAFINVSPARFYRHTHISAQQCRARIPPPCPRTWAKYAGQIRISVSLSRLAITGPTLLHSSPIQMPTFLSAAPKRGISRFLHDSARETNEESFVLKLKTGDDEL